MPLPLGFVVFLLLPLCQVSGLKLSVQTNYFEIGGSGVTLECNLEGAAWNINNSPRTWSAPPNTLTVISDGLANAGYAEDLSDAATSGIIRMTTPPLDWSIENQFFQCSYQIDTSSLNATRNILARNSGGNASYDESTKKCVFTISEILPTPTKVVTHVSSGSGEFDISNDVRVMETITINNDQGQTYNYHIEVDGSKMKDGDQVKFRVKAGPYTENGSCVIKQSGLGPGATAGIVIAAVEIIAAAVLALLWRMQLLCFKEPGLRCCDKAGIVIAVLVGVVVLPAVVIVILWKTKKLCFKGEQNGSELKKNSQDSENTINGETK